MKQILILVLIILVVIFIVIGLRIHNQNKEISNIEKAVITDTATEIEERSGDVVTITKTASGLSSEGQVEINNEETYLNFTGFGPGKSHVGSFDAMTADIVFNEGSVVGGKLVIEASSIKSDNKGLDSHLKSADFLEVEKYSQIIFTLNNVEVSDEDQSAIANGTLEMKGIKKDISVPLTILANGFYADFTIDASLFDISYTGVNDEIKVETQVVWE